jgi:hypothetical protein
MPIPLLGSEQPGFPPHTKVSSTRGSDLSPSLCYTEKRQLEDNPRGLQHGVPGKQSSHPCAVRECAFLKLDMKDWLRDWLENPAGKEGSPLHHFCAPRIPYAYIFLAMLPTLVTGGSSFFMLNLREQSSLLYTKDGFSINPWARLWEKQFLSVFNLWWVERKMYPLGSCT